MRYAAGLLASVILITGCGTDVPRDTAAPVEQWRLDPEPVLFLGDDANEDEVFHLVASVHVFADERLAVADWGTHGIRIYDFSGELLRQIGREGRGPGESRHLTGVWYVNSDTIEILDATEHRVTRYLRDGTLLDTRTLSEFHRATGIADGRAADGGYVDVTGIHQDAEGSIVPELLTYDRIAPDGAHVGPVASMQGRWFYVPQTSSNIPQPGFAAGTHPLSPRGRAIVRDDTLFFSSGLKPEISLFPIDGGEPRRIDLPPNEIPAEQAMSELRRTLRESGSDRRLTQLQQVPEVDSVPHIGTFLIDAEGLIWAKKYDPATDNVWGTVRTFGDKHGGEWWVVDRAGTPRATITLPDRFVPMHVRDSLIAGIHVDELDVERVVVYRIDRGS